MSNYSFSFLQNKISKKWVISAPKRAKRPDIANGTEPPCPFCPGKEGDEDEYYRIGGENGDAHWKVRVIPNKFPFTPHHELVLNSPDHHISFDEFSVDQINLIFQAYKHRFNEHHHKGQVYIFHNHGQKAGESIPHSHTQVAVVPEKVYLDLPRLQNVSEDEKSAVESKHFFVFCPHFSVWPDEVWIAPKRKGLLFGEINKDEIDDLSGVFSTLIKIMTARHGGEFPYNFYIYPGGDWYMRLIPREKVTGGFEVGTGVFVNTQNPQETMEFLKEHFKEPNFEKIKKEHQADYHRGS